MGFNVSPSTIAELGKTNESPTSPDALSGLSIVHRVLETRISV